MSRATLQSDTPPNAAATRTFDGIIFFGGEDWWYHNRGHYDMQMAHQFARHVPVLYVNSIGMRPPSVGTKAQFAKRVARKLRSLRRGLVSVRDSFTVFSPLAAPGRLGRLATRHVMPRQVRRAAGKTGITRPLVWVACPPAEAVLDELDPVGVVYQRTDRFEDYLGVDREEIAGYDRRLKDRADLVLFCSTHLYEAERGDCREALFVDHGVDFDHFAKAADRRKEPDDVKGIARPRVGFVGGIDAVTFNPPLFVEVAKTLSDVRFVLVGSCSLGEGWCDLPNVHLLGQRNYIDVAAYMASCDVLIMPWNQSEWIKACNPVKLKEYLAVRRPVVTTWFDELARYDGLVRVARGADAFAAAIRASIDNPGNVDAGFERVRDETWVAKRELVRARLGELGLEGVRS